MGSIEKRNDKIANINYYNMSLYDIGSYICPTKRAVDLKDFMLSGTECHRYYEILRKSITSAFGQMPVFIIHHKTNISSVSWNFLNSEGLGEISSGSVCYVGGRDQTYIYEPFLGMSEGRIVDILRKLAKKMDFEITSHYDNIIRGFIEILKLTDQSVSLSSFEMLCSVRTIKEFHDKLLSLSDRRQAEMIFNSFGLDKESRLEQLYILRSVIRGFIYEMAQSGWQNIFSCDKTPVNLISAVKQSGSNTFVCLCVEDIYSEVFFTYLAEEFKAMKDLSFFLIFDNIRFTDENLLNYLAHPGVNSHIGIISENLPASIRTTQDGVGFAELAERAGSIVILKHRTASAAQAFSEVIGNYDELQEQVSQGKSKENTAILSSVNQSGVQYNLINRFRVMPEHILSMAGDEVCVFDADSDSINYITIT